MGKEKSSTFDVEEDDTKFHGEASEGLFDAVFDRKVQYWAVKSYGDSYVNMVWESTLVDINALE